MVMKGVGVAELRTRLSEYLRKVRRGRTLVVLDRQTPIARLVPYEDDAALLRLRPPLPDAPRLQDVPLPPPLRLRIDVVTLLLEERQGHR
jgi:prevent-host-death family protein